jgi:hypothetical protein
VSSVKKETDKFLDQVRAAGAEVKRGGSGHWKVYLNGRMITSVAVSGSDQRGLRNARANVRRAGLQIP